MRNALTAAFLLMLSLGATQAMADCTRPRAGFTIPDGSTASEQDMKSAQRELMTLDQQVGDYLRCLKGEVSQQTVGKDAATREKLMTQYVTSHNTATDELAGLADCFNAQLNSFRSANTGGGAKPAAGSAGAAKPADCSSFLQAAAKAASSSKSAAAPAPAPGGTPAPSSIVKEADGYSFEVPGGAWSYTLIRDETPRRCVATGKECWQRTVFVRNGSPQDLECKAYITYEGTDAAGKQSTDAQAVVLANTIRGIVTSTAERGVSAQTFEAQCSVRPPLPALSTPSTCKYEVVKPVQISDFYPAAARTAGEEGPVVVEFTVQGKAANPTDVKVVASSLSPRLDQGAVEAVSAMVMSSACKKERYRLRLNFQLEE